PCRRNCNFSFGRGPGVPVWPSAAAKAGGKLLVRGPRQVDNRAPLAEPPVIRFQCPTCRKILKVPDEGAGRKVPCPKCGQRLLVPPSATPSAVPRQWTPEPHTAAITAACPGCGRAIPVQPHELALTFECAQCDTRFIPAGLPFGPDARPVAD